MTDKNKQAKRDARAAETASKDRTPPPVHTHADVPRATPAEAVAADQPPDDARTLAARAMLGKCVRALVGGHMTTILLTDWNESSDSYNGTSIRSFSMDTSEKAPVIIAVTGLRAYPYKERPDYAFQFVQPGGSEHVLRNLARHSATRE